MLDLSLLLTLSGFTFFENFLLKTAYFLCDFALIFLNLSSLYIYIHLKPQKKKNLIKTILS